MADLGSDFSGILDIDSALTVVEGERCFAEGLARRLTTPAGRMLGDPDYGHDLRQYINAAINNTSHVSLAGENECLKDERTEGVTAEVTLESSVQELSADIKVKVSDDEFEFTLNVTETTAAILLPESQ